MIGYCSTIEHLSTVLSNGFDYLETTAKEIQTATIDPGSPIFSLNNLLPRDIELYKPGGLERAKKETINAFIAADSNHIQTITLGSGRCRTTSSDTPSKEEVKIWNEYLNIVDQLSHHYSIKVGLEPLTKTETNFLNYIDEAAVSLEEAGCENIGITIDSFHFFANNDLYRSIEKHGHLIKHIHIAEGSQREAPTNLNKDLREFLEAVTSNSSCREVAVETHWDLPCTPHASLVKELREYGF